MFEADVFIRSDRVCSGWQPQVIRVPFCYPIPFTVVSVNQKPVLCFGSDDNVVSVSDELSYY
jgi:hypothetical protein